MLDLGTSFVASVARDPDAVAVVDHDVRLTYAQWYARISSLIASLDRIGLKPGDHLVTVLQNCEAAATLHWACQLAGIVITPVNWRAKADELDFCIENAEGRAVVYQDVSAAAVAESRRAAALARICAGRGDTTDAFRFDRMVVEAASDATPRVPKPGRSCSTHPAPRQGRKECRGVTAPSGPPASRILRRISIGAASGRSA
jgi:2-furoate---CoA ligase